MNKPLQPSRRVVELTDAEAETLDAVLEGGAFSSDSEAIGAALSHLRVRQMFGSDRADAVLDQLLDEDEAHGGPEHDAEEVFARLIAKYEAMSAAKPA
ncbi:MAG: hypothetical protein JWP35_288 [Caulobacter sp.]|nr:hypothetical protein [Caulobacter sp.]